VRAAATATAGSARPRARQRGFSLLEVLVALAIAAAGLSVCLAVLGPTLARQRAVAVASERQVELHTAVERLRAGRLDTPAGQGATLAASQPAGHAAAALRLERWQLTLNGGAAPAAASLLQLRQGPP
jgi:prepilin-type N-terminal cleavage/methylation domain-containing protein